MNKLKNLLNTILDAIFPKNITCISCNEELRNEQEKEFCICAACKEKLVYIGDKTQEISNKNLGFTDFVTVFAYDGIARNLIIGFKDGNKPYLGEYIGNFLIAEYKKKSKTVELVTYVPSSKDKINQRGFDPMEIVTKVFSKGSGIKAVCMLKRKNKQIGQTESVERYQNIKGQFEFCGENIKGKSILLIDDVVTTGATAAECSKLLINNGAKKVVLLTFAEAKSFSDYKHQIIKRMEKHSNDRIIC